jgi:sulfate-transporting ATPase
MVVAGVLGAVLALTWFAFDADWTDSLITTAVVGIVCLSLVVVTGFTGQVSLAQFTLAGMGAWVAVRLADAHSIPFEVALLVGAVGALPVGLLVALPSLRVRGVNLAVATLGMALALDYLVLQNVHAIQRNDFQILQIEPPSLFGIDINRVDHPARYATVVVVIFTVLMILVANLRRGRAGRRMIAVRTNERAAASLGISVFGAKLFAFGLGAALAGIGGVLVAFTSTAPQWTTFSVGQSINAVVYAVIGGVGFVIGPIFAGFFAIGSLGGKTFDLLGDWVGVDLQNVFQVVGGLGLIAILLQDPNGLASQNIRQWRSTARRLHVDRAFRTRPARPLPDVARSPVSPRPLEICDLGVRFGGVIALDGANVVVNPGEVVGLIGPNGAGKSTLIDAVTGFVRPSSGTVSLDGKPIGSLSARRRAQAGIGRSFQSLELFEDMTVRDNLRTASEPRDRRAYLTDLVRPGDPPLSPTAVAAIREFGLEDDLDRRPGELPHGRRRLVGIARAIAAAPSVLLLDEPAAGLDDHETAELGNLIRRLARDWGLAVLLVEHDVGLVLRVCDRIVVLDFGRIIAQGLPEEIRVDPVVVAAYLGVDPDRDPIRAGGDSSDSIR